MSQIPSIAEVDHISRLREPVVRNLKITLCYHELASALFARAGGANWCCFATWASRQAGQSIRKEDLLRALEHVLTASPVTRRAVKDVAAVAQPHDSTRSLLATNQAIWDALNPFAAVERVSAAVAQGNRKVFAEIGREFARFAATRLEDPAYDAGAIAQFCTELRDGKPPVGQHFLRRAFALYYQALFERDKKAQAELMLCANLAIGYHEQTRLQPEILAAMQASSIEPEPMTRRVIAAIFPARGAVAYADWRSRSRDRQFVPLDNAIARVLAITRKQVRRFLTEHLMTLWIPPDTRLCLGDDLRAQFPASLKVIANPELRALLEQIDPTPDTTTGSGADDWGNLGDRLHFIADLFRSYHESPNLLLPPFTAEQIVELRAGHKPSGLAWLPTSLRDQKR